MRKSIAAAAALAIAVSGPLAAQERFTDPAGGPGGQQFISRCPRGALVSGVSVMVGAYINNIAPICDNRLMKGAGGSGPRRTALCPVGSVVHSIWYMLLRSDNHLLKDIVISCTARGTGESTGHVDLTTAGRPTALYYPSGNMDCGTKNIAGFQGRSGDAVDALGLICR